MSSAPQFVKINWRDQSVSIEFQWIDAKKKERPLIIFLHEGLGSVDMWREYPKELCNALNARGLVYSRPGYGRSCNYEPGTPWSVDFMHKQAFEVLPALLSALNIKDKPWLFGHSDGGSIALLHASKFPVSGLIVLAPHIMVENVSISSIENARDAFVNTNLRERLSRYHTDVDSVFWGWNQIWLAPEFRTWTIKEEISTIKCPVLAVQGVEDEYGTMAQIKGIFQRVKQTQLAELAHCGHSPHRDQPQLLTQLCLEFFNQYQSH